MKYFNYHLKINAFFERKERNENYVKSRTSVQKRYTLSANDTEASFASCKEIA
jgi:hypothetical protein